MDSFNDYTDETGQQPAAIIIQPTAHPLYHTAESLINKGNWPAAQAVLEELLILYPNDPYLHELVASARARSALLGTDDEDTSRSTRPSIVSLGLKLVIPGIIVMAVLCSATGIFAGLQWWILPEANTRRLEGQIGQLRQESQAALASGDYDRAVLAYNQLLELLPDDRQVRQELRQVNELRAVVSLYSEAIAEMEAHRWDSALSILQQIEADQPGYGDVAERIQFIQSQQELSTYFEKAEAAFAKGDYEQAIKSYEMLQSLNSNFQSGTVQEHLFLSYLQLGLAEEAAAGSNVKRLQSALEHFDKALALRPGDSQARGESKLLRLYLTSQDAFESKNWPQVIADLTTVYEARSDFAGGGAAQRLYEAYVAWGDELFEREEAEDALAKYEAARKIRGIDASSLGPKIALSKEAMATPTPEPARAPAVASVSSGGGAAAPRPTATPIPYPYTLRGMSIRNNCGGAYIHGVVWNAYGLPLAGVTVQAINTTTGAGPFYSNPTNADGIYQIILNPDQLDGLWMVQILENGQPVSLGWGQHMGGGCVNGVQELKADWKREVQLQ